MTRFTSTRLERLGLIELMLGLPAGIVVAESLNAPWLGALLVGGGVLFAILVVSRPFRLVALGLVAGAVAGLIVGGAGGRLTMRLVSVMGGRREMTMEGTAFLLLFTAFAGGAFGVLLSAWRRFKAAPSWATGLATMVFPGLPLLVGDPVARAELLQEGEAWFNFPAFFGLLFAYGFLSHRLMDWLDNRLPDSIAGRRKRRSAAGLG